VAIACGLCWAVAAGPHRSAAQTADPAAGSAESRFADEDGSELARKADILHSPQWQRAIAELRGWLATQSVYTPSEVRRIKMQFNARLAAMTSFELEYLLDSITAKMRLLDTPEARDAKAWLGEYLSTMSDARRAEELRNVPNILEMSADQLWREIQRIDSLRGNLRQRQQGVEARQGGLAARADAGRDATSAAARATAARLRAAPAHSPYRSRGGSPPFSDVQPRQMSIGVGPMGAFITL
jgi:hypothetical protein